MYVPMRGMLQRANEGNCTVMAVSCFNIEITGAVISVTQDLRVSIIINIVQEHMVNYCDSELIAPIVKLLVQRASVEVVLNLDHREEIGYSKEALHDGYSNVMMDVLHYDPEGNIEVTKGAVEFARQSDVPAEGEIGYVGGNEGGNYTNDIMKTNPQQALCSVKETGTSVLAASLGSSHGNYPGGYVSGFDFERLKRIKEPTKIPLVLYGDSGPGNRNIEDCVRYGINKINIGCDFMNVNVDSTKKHLEKDSNINYWVMMHQAETDSHEAIRYHIRLPRLERESL